MTSLSKKYTLDIYIEALKQEGLFSSCSHNKDEYQDILIEDITYDSREAKDNTMFVCKGAAFKEEYLKQAIEQGAPIYVSEREYQIDAPYILVNDVRAAMVTIANIYYDQVWKKLNLVGITGTKGKSTTAYFLKSIFDEYENSQGKPESAILSSIDNYDGVIREESHITTPETFVLHKHFNNAVNSGISYFSMEVSSQALKYDRTKGITFDVAAFLNIGIDHISDIEHANFEDYFTSKLKIFDQCNTAIVNLESHEAERILEAARNAKNPETNKPPLLLTFGIEKNDANLSASDISNDNGKLSFTASGNDVNENFTLPIPGYFNLENALCAILVAMHLEIPMDCIKSGLAKAEVPGRMEVIHDEEKDLHIIVDYAHNEMSFTNLFESVKKEYPDSKISIVFGCPGGKALGRRKELGNVAGRYADMSYLTEEDAGKEDVHKISQEIASHVEEVGGSCKIIDDRKEAITCAIEDATEGTVILITGKGRETRMKRGGEYITTPSDIDYVKDILR